MAFSLSARKEWSVWTLESSYVGDWEERELNNTWKNRLSLGASVVYDGWTVSPRAVFSWRDSEKVGKDTNFRFNLRRDL